MRLTIDTTEAQSFELVEPGPYHMLIDSIGEPAKGEKATYVPVAFAFADPMLAQKSGKVYRNYPIEGKGSGFFRELWKAATGEDIPIGVTIDVDTDEAIGRPVVVNIGHRTHEGRTYNDPQNVTAMP